MRAYRSPVLGLQKFASNLANWIVINGSIYSLYYI